MDVIGAGAARLRHWLAARPLGAATTGGVSVPAAAAAAAASAVFVGSVRHRRHLPRPHRFRYPLFMLYLDLAEIEHVFDGRWLWSSGGRNVAAFHRSDYLGDPALPLDEAVRQRVQQAIGRRPAGPIRLLTHLRYFGYCFNPVSLYYCFEADGRTLDCLVAEITNTPWGERHSYVLAAADAERHGATLDWQFDKTFHVSPFLSMQRRYRWRLQPPGAALAVHMEVLAGATSEFDATLSLERRPLGAGQLARCLLAHPWMTARVWLGIHWQAFIIWCKRIPVHDHPRHRTDQPGPQP